MKNIRRTYSILIAVIFTVITVRIVHASTLGVPTYVLNLQSGLITWFTMDGPDLTYNVADRSGSNLDGNLNLGSAGSIATTTGPGVIGQALILDGYDDYINVPMGPTGVETVSFWEKVSTTTTQGFMTLSSSVSISASSTGALKANGFSSPTIYVDAVSTSSPFIDKGWHFIVVTTATPLNATLFQIGKAASVTCGCKIDSVSIYNRVLDPSEVTELYIRGSGKTRNKTIVGPLNLMTGLVGWWTFDGRDTIGTTTAKDVSASGFNASTNNFLAVATSSINVTTGSRTWLAPPGVIYAKIEAWGAGGAGGGSGSTLGNSASGGAGGAYARRNTYMVTPGVVYNYFVGAAGIASTAATGTIGQGSSFNGSTTLLATGGGGGSLGGNSPQVAGATTSGSVGDVVFQGGNGALGVASGLSGGGGGGGGSTAPGTAASGITGGTGGAAENGNGGAGVASGNTTAAGTAGTAPGGGGGGGHCKTSGSCTAVTGGAGAIGRVKITAYYGSNWGIGKIGQGAVLDGVAGSLSVGTAFNGVQTVSFWAKTSTTTTQYFIQLASEVSVSASSTGTVNANGFTSPTVTIDAGATTTIDKNWHMITVTTGTGVNASNMLIGQGGTAQTTCGCTLDDVRIYSRVLSSTEISQLYALDAGSRVDLSTIGTLRFTNNLLGWWTFDGPDMLPPNDILDRSSSGDGLNLSLGSGGNTSTTTVPGKMGQALVFDGVDDFASSTKNISGIKTVSFWEKVATTTTTWFMQLASNISISASSTGTVNANGFTSPTVTIDAGATTTIDKNWHLITVTTATPVSANAFLAGKAGTLVCGCSLDDIRFYSSALSSTDMKKLYNMAH